jgi:hypothetical protein
MTWIDGSRWDKDRGKRLVKLLSQTYHSELLILAVMDAVELDREEMPLLPTVGERWIELTRTMHEARLLRRVADQLVTDLPALAAKVADIAADPPEAMDHNPEDIYEVVLLYGQRPLIDRADLRTVLRDFLDKQVPLLVIRGQPRTGKSFSVDYLQHVTEPLANLLVTVVDFAPAANGDSAAALIGKTCRRLDLGAVTSADPSTATWQAIDLVDAFIGRYRNTFTDRKRRLLVNRRAKRDRQLDHLRRRVVGLVGQR